MVEKMKLKRFDKAIINPYNNLGLSEILNDVKSIEIKNICEQCYESNNFVLFKITIQIYLKSKEYGLQVVYGI